MRSGRRCSTGEVNERRGYYADTTDEQWALIEPVITAWKALHPSVSGHTGRYDMRSIVDAVFCRNCSGCQWSLLPSDFPPASAVKHYFDELDADDDQADPEAHDLGEGLAEHDARGNCGQGDAG